MLLLIIHFFATSYLFPLSRHHQTINCFIWVTREGDALVHQKFSSLGTATMVSQLIWIHRYCAFYRVSLETRTCVSHKDIQDLARTGASLGKPTLRVKGYTYRKQTETVLTIPHTFEIVNLGEKILWLIYFVSLTQRWTMNEPSPCAT